MNMANEELIKKGLLIKELKAKLDAYEGNDFKGMRKEELQKIAKTMNESSKKLNSYLND